MVDVRIHLAHVVEVAMGHSLLLVDLDLRVEQAVQIEPFLEELEPHPREALDVGGVHDLAQLTVVCEKLLENGRWRVDRLGPSGNERVPVDMGVARRAL